MTTNSIAKILTFEDVFIGVFPRDQLPSIKSHPTSFVINTDPSYK
jgi:hypothetical protein